MKIITSVNEMQEQAGKWRVEGKSVGFVPTMGFLHEGHLTLVQQSTQACDITVMSIFVNPLQFGPNEDFELYPRNIEQDQKHAEAAGVDVLFCPTAKELYPQELPVKMVAVKRTDRLCGVSRPGHFDGVVTVLSILFHVVQPTVAYFGRKDAQQVAVVQGLVEAYRYPVKIVAIDTVRESDGLAKSSRNVYLSNQEREEAPFLFKALTHAKKLAKNHSTEEILKETESIILNNTSGKIDYIEMLSYPYLEKIQFAKGTVIIALAVQFSQARLIDNVVFTLEEG
ncbi:pantoate--beta-alanine ligase [Jeotgalibacillus soli]|uniref:Pantothenate synthetase n=1 Tax=Jeotgalibacillus soli TaxID=889306 RepID=A0A0C2VI40_9BACL|nr:pantoate--beta-alanine ligase [Jeotgalibacillus soli]KIL44176.1 pantoate--beta-alanine ligase [Jeotgalibacillus soli]